MTRVVTPEKHQHQPHYREPKRQQRRHIPDDTIDTTLDTTQQTWDDDTATLDDTVTLNDTFDQGTVVSLEEAPKSFFDKIRDEIFGAIEDTTASLEDVFSAFTLREEDIRAVMGRIDKAKRQMEGSI